MLGEHPIVDLREVPGFNFGGQTAAGFLISTSTFHGETTSMLKFAWKPNDGDEYIQISSVPTRNVKYLVLDDPDAKSTVQFTGIKPEELLKDPALNGSDNVNDFVDRVSNQMTILTLSKENWDKFRGTQGK